MSKETKIGTVYVDSGMVWLGDPCYVIGGDASHSVDTWEDFCDKLDFHKNYSAPLGKGIGFAVSSGFGDGEYPAYVTIDNGGTVTSIRVDFAPDDEDYDEEYDEDYWAKADKEYGDENGK